MPLAQLSLWKNHCATFVSVEVRNKLQSKDVCEVFSNSVSSDSVSSDAVSSDSTSHGLREGIEISWVLFWTVHSVRSPQWGGYNNRNS